jgi:hypothetical protein
MKDGSYKFNWIKFYMELADRLMMYRDDRSQLL